MLDASFAAAGAGRPSCTRMSSASRSSLKYHRAEIDAMLEACQRAHAFVYGSPET